MTTTSTMADLVPQLHMPLPIPHTGTSMPRPGFGVYKIPPAACKAACLAALEVGYRHIDCAQLYRSEAQVCEATQASSSLAARSDVFLTTKIKTCNKQASAYEQVLASVERIGGAGGYVDLFLVHSPRFEGQQRREVWLALEKLYEDGRARAIGVSNYGIQHLEQMRGYATVWPPHVNQIELHPWCQQRDLVKYCQRHNIVIQAYSPLAMGSRLADPVVTSISAKHTRSPAQVLIRYSLQKGWVPLPKSHTATRIKENLNVFDFSLEENDMEQLDALDEGTKGALFPANIVSQALE